MENLYKAFAQIFENERKAKSTGMRFCVKTVHEIIIFAQNSQFFWYGGIDIQGWSNCIQLWRGIKWFSFDNLALELSVFPQFLLFLVFLYLAFLLFILYVITMTFKKKAVRNEVILAGQILIYLISDLFFIPICLTIFLCIKYSAIDQTAFIEYNIGQITSDLVFGGPGKYLSFILAILHILTGYLYEGISYDIRHKDDGLLSNSKISTKSDIFLKTLCIVNCYCMFWLKDGNYRMYLGFCVITYIITGGSYLYYLPYYCKYMNFFKAVFGFECGFLALFFLLALKNDSAYLAVYLMVFIQPFLIILVYHSISFRISKIPAAETAWDKSFLDMERALRQRLSYFQGDAKVVKILSKHYKLFSHKYDLILQAYYLLDSYSNASLALTKVSRLKLTTFNVFSNIQMVKCKLTCEKGALTSPLSSIYKNFMNYSKAKNFEKDFCIEYTKFLNEILKKDCKISTLKRSTQTLVLLKGKIMKIYGNLVYKFIDPSEVQETYGSLLSELLGEMEIGKSILARINSEIYNNKIGPDRISGSKRSYFIVSAGKKDFGKIKFYTKRFLTYLEFSEEAANLLTIEDLLPARLHKNHIKNFESFLRLSISNKTKNCEGNFILDSKGFAHECRLTVESVGSDWSVNFFCGLDIFLNEFEFLILDKQGVILGHSRNAGILLEERHHIEGLNLNSLLSFEVYPNCEVNKKFEGVLIKSMNIIYFFCKDKEKQNVVIYISQDRKSFKTNEKIRPSFSKEYLENDTHLKKSRKFKPKKKASNQIEVNDSDKKVSDKGLSSASSFKNTLSKVETVSIKRSMLALKISKYMLMISVIIIILSNIASTIYISKEISHSNSLQAYTDISALAYYIMQAALTVEKIRLNNESQLFGRLSATADLLDYYKSLIISDYDSWSYCQASLIVNKPIIPEYLSESSTEYSSLHSIVEKYVASAKSLVDKHHINPQDENVKFILFNSFGKALSQISAAIKDLKNCEIDRINDLSNTNIFLLIAAVSCLIAQITVLTLYMISIDKYLNHIWNDLKHRVLRSYFDLKNTLEQRLKNYHQYEPMIEEALDQTALKSPGKLKFRHSLNFLMKFLLLYIIASVLFMATSFYFFEKIRNGLVQRPALLMALSERRVQTTELGFFVMQYQHLNEDSVYDVYRDFSIFPEYDKRIRNIVKVIQGARSKITSADIQEILSQKFKGYLFDTVPNEAQFLNTGTISGLNEVIYNSYYIINSNISYNLTDYFLMIDQFNNLSILATQLASDDSKDYANNRFNDLVYFTTFTYLVILLLYFFYLLPLVNDEINVVTKVHQVLKIVPRK